MVQDDDDLFLADPTSPRDPDLDALLDKIVRLERDDEPRIVVGTLVFEDLDYLIVDEHGEELAYFDWSRVAAIKGTTIYLERSEIIQEAINRAEEHGWDHPLL